MTTDRAPATTGSQPRAGPEPATGPVPPDPDRWYHDAVGYQVYVRSFADGDGDGVGDLWGVLDHVDHVASLGVDFVWLNPVYPSPGLDHGYDVADYTTVADDMGGMAAFEAVRDALHDRGIRVLMDIVPGHTSHTHRWFRAALQDPDSRYRDYYVWRDPGPDGGPPNNWQSVFGGPAWELDEASGQYWMHRFLPEQPDLDWHNPAVREELESVLRLWLGRGVDGFRIDVAQGMLYDETWADVPPPDPTLSPDDAHDRAFSGFMGRPGTPELYRSWRTIADRHDALLLGEVYLSSAKTVATYVSEGLLTRAFYLPLQHTTWDRDEVAAMLEPAVAAGNGRFAWPQSSHDDVRAGSRFGGGRLGRRRALAFFHLLATLPGNPVLLAGDELGLDNGEVPRDVATDPITTRNADREDGRDGSRTPMPWDDSAHFGFTTGTPWLPVGRNRTAADTVAHQDADPDSALNRFRHLLAVRKDLAGMLASDDVAWLDLGASVLALRRGNVVAACNFGDETTLAVPAARELVVASSDDARLDGAALTIGADTTVLVEVDVDGGGPGSSGREGAT